jgi:hypothetical protein
VRASSAGLCTRAKKKQWRRSSLPAELRLRGRTVVGGNNDTQALSVSAPQACSDFANNYHKTTWCDLIWHFRWHFLFFFSSCLKGNEYIDSTALFVDLTNPRRGRRAAPPLTIHELVLHVLQRWDIF